MSDPPSNLGKLGKDAFLDAIPHLAAGDKHAFTSELIRGIVGAVAGKVAGDAAGNAVQAALEGKFDSPADKIFRHALAVLEEEQAQEQSIDRVAERLRSDLGTELADILAQLVRVQINTQSEVLEQLEIIRTTMASSTHSSEDTDALRAAYGALDQRFETYSLAAKNLRDRFEYEAGLFLDANEAADEALTVAMVDYNEAYEDLRVNQQAYLDSVRRWLAPDSKPDALLSVVYATLLDDVHRRGFLALNRNRAEMIDLRAHRPGPDTSPAARASAAEAKLAVLERLRAALREINDSLEGLDRKLGLLRSAIAERVA